MSTRSVLLLGLSILLIASCASSPVSPEDPAPTESRSALRTTEITGSIDLPVTGPADPGEPLELTVLTAAGSAEVGDGGSFVVAGVDTDKQQLMIVKNGKGKSFAMAYGRHKNNPSPRISARSTGLSLVMLNPMFLYASDVQRDSMMAIARRHQDFQELETRVFRAWKDDPEDPLEPAQHPEMYQIAAQIAHDVYAGGDALGDQAARRGRKEPVIRDKSGTWIKFENDMCVNFGAGIRPAGGGDTEAIPVWAKDKAIRLVWAWPPWVEVSPNETDHDLGYGRFIVDVSKGFHGSWADFDTAEGTASAWNITKGVVLTMDLLAGISAASNPEAPPELNITNEAANGLQTAITGQDTWSAAGFTFDIIMASASNIAAWYWADATDDARREFVNKAHGAIKRIANVAAWIQLGWDFGNKAIPFFYDLIDANSSRTYYLIHDENGLVVTENFPPERPEPPTGPPDAYVGRAVTLRATTTDPDGEDISYRFHWGYGETSEWSEPIASGDTLIVEHAFTTPGFVNVTVEAIDTNGIPSEMSEPLPVRVRYLPAIVDLFPQRYPNVVRLHNGVEWVHLAGTEALEVASVDPGSITLSVILPSAPAARAEDRITVLHPLRMRVGDMTDPNAVEAERPHPGAVKDGVDDLILSFDNGDLRSMLGLLEGPEYMVHVMGRLQDGTVFEAPGVLVMQDLWNTSR